MSILIGKKLEERFVIKLLCVYTRSLRVDYRFSIKTTERALFIASSRDREAIIACIFRVTIRE